MRVTDLTNTTASVKPDEKCYGVLDIDMLTPDYKAHHRYRLTYVIRDDKPTPYVEDLTLGGRYSVLAIHPMVQLFTLLEHTVAESWQICDEVYARPQARDRLRELAEKAQDESIVKEYWRRQDMANRFVRRNRRTAERVSKQ